MKMQKYTAPDMRTALRKVRAAHGPDALILFTRRAAGVVELTVATDAEAAAGVGSLTALPRAVGAEQGMASPRPVPPVRSIPALAEGRPDAALPVEARAVAATASDVVAEGAPVAGPLVASPAVGRHDGIDGELKALRRLLETQLAALAWNDLTRRSPVTAELLRDFAALGLDRTFAQDLMAAVTPSDDLTAARREAQQVLLGRLPITADRWSEQGGVLAVVGPAGAGKTQAVAAIAARWVLRHGPSGAALVSAGDPRFGAFDQLARMGRLLGVPTYQLDSAAELPALLSRLRDQRLVLVDTGAPPAGAASAEAAAAAVTALRTVAEVAVTLPATSQAAALKRTAARYAALGATAAIATRLDEAESLGGLLSALSGAALPLAYTLHGTRLPDDLRPARAEDLLEQASALVARHGTVADEDLLISRFEGRVHATL